MLLVGVVNFYNAGVVTRDRRIGSLSELLTLYLRRSKTLDFIETTVFGDKNANSISLFCFDWKSSFYFYF
jgi:hypothetical protein